MKRIITCLAAMACVTMLFMSLVACGPNYKENFAGDWRVVTMQDSNGVDMTPTLEQLAAANRYLTLSLAAEEDEAVFEMADQNTLTGTWEPKGEATCVIDFEGYKQIVATLSDDGTLVFEDNDQVMTCERIEAE